MNAARQAARKERDEAPCERTNVFSMTPHGKYLHGFACLTKAQNTRPLYVNFFPLATFSAGANGFLVILKDILCVPLSLIKI